MDTYVNMVHMTLTEHDTTFNPGVSLLQQEKYNTQTAVYVIQTRTYDISGKIKARAQRAFTLTIYFFFLGSLIVIW